MSGDRFIRTMKAVSEITDMVFGVVTSVSPLKIKVDNRFEIDSDFIILSDNCVLKSITIPAQTISFTAHTNSHSVTVPASTVVLWDNLIVGNTVKMLRCSKGQLYYVLERVI